MKSDKSNTYRTPFLNWDEFRWSREALAPAAATPNLRFASPQYTLLDKNPRVQLAPVEVQRDLEAYEAAMFPESTDQLETGTVDRGIRLVMNDVDLPPDMRADATKVAMDEHWHELKARSVRDWIYKAAAIEPVKYTSSFEIFVEETLSDASREVTDAKRVMATVVTETMISHVMSGLPMDLTVQPVVREFARGRAKDEARHSAYMQAVARYLLTESWPPELRRAVLSSVPDTVRAFLAPDLNALAAMLKKFPRDFPSPKEILNDVPTTSAEATKAAARPLLAMLRSVGAFEDDDVATAFRRAALL